MSFRSVIFFLLIISPLTFVLAQNESVNIEKKSAKSGLINFSDSILPIAYGQAKFIGNVYSASQWPGFKTYWNQVTPENAGKWGSVEKSRDYMSWVNLDAAYNAAKNNNMPFKLHVLVWGNQQPSWIENLNAPEKREEIQEWFSAIANRYPDIDYVEVVNEPLHDPPNQAGNGGGNYFDALGGSGESGWDWVVRAFNYARSRFPNNTKLMLNEYNIVNSETNTNSYIEIIELLKTDTLIDAIGIQAHAFSLNTSVTNISNNLDRLAETGLPIFVTELDIDGPTDETQLKEYQRIFPVFWNHPSVKGITLWGYRPGMWRTQQKAYLINANNIERPALVWLREYVNGTFVKVNSVKISSHNDVTTIDSDDGTLQLTATLLPENVTFPGVTWDVFEKDIATIDENGLLTALQNGTVSIVAKAVDGSDKKNYFRVTITNQVIVGINDFKLPENSITLFPNPSSDGNFTINRIEKIKSIEVRRLDGKLIKKINVENKTSATYYMNIDQGIYLIQMFDGNRI
ncbi:MAG: endo-1,4-beta-xylanase [Mariniphaga sp.]|nr:endo-1,4-beta-xylanase [Mariniphaga sp.]